MNNRSSGFFMILMAVAFAMSLSAASSGAKARVTKESVESFFIQTLQWLDNSTEGKPLKTFALELFEMRSRFDTTCNSANSLINGNQELQSLRGQLNDKFALYNRIVAEGLDLAASKGSLSSSAMAASSARRTSPTGSRATSSRPAAAASSASGAANAYDLDAGIAASLAEPFSKSASAARRTPPSGSRAPSPARKISPTAGGAAAGRQPPVYEYTAADIARYQAAKAFVDLQKAAYAAAPITEDAEGFRTDLQRRQILCHVIPQVQIMEEIERKGYVLPGSADPEDSFYEAALAADGIDVGRLTPLQRRKEIADLQGRQSTIQDSIAAQRASAILTAAQPAVAPSRSSAVGAAAQAVEQMPIQVLTEREVLRQPGGWECGHYAVFFALCLVNDQLHASGDVCYEPDLKANNDVKFQAFFKLSKSFLYALRLLNARDGVSVSSLECVNISSDDIANLLEEILQPDSLFLESSRVGGPFRNTNFLNYARAHICSPITKITRDVAIQSVVAGRDLGCYLDVAAIHATLRFNHALLGDFVVVVHNVASSDLHAQLTQAQAIARSANPANSHWVCCKFIKGIGSRRVEGVYADSGAGTSGLSAARLWGQMLMQPDLPRLEDLPILKCMADALQSLEVAYRFGVDVAVTERDRDHYLGLALARLQEARGLLTAGGARFDRSIIDQYNSMVVGDYRVRRALGKPDCGLAFIESAV